MKTSARSVAWEKLVPPATLLLVSLLAAAPLWGPGLLNTRGGGDSPFLLFRTHQLAANLRAGVFPARWMPDAAYGLGYPFFNYYAALPYYLAASLSLAGLGVLTALKLTQSLFVGAAALAMYAWARRVLGGRSAAWLAAVAYTVAPFHLVNVYVRGDSLSEFAAFAFYPLILWGLDRLAAAPSFKHSLLPGIGYATLILTHNVSALIFSPFLLLYVLFYLGEAIVPVQHRSWRTALCRSGLLFLPLVLGLLLSAWFWLPALGETRYVQLDAQTTGYFFYGNHFRAADLVQRGFLFDYNTGGESTSAFSMGLVQTVLISLGTLTTLFVTVRHRRSAPPARLGENGSGAHHRGHPRRILILATLSLLTATWMITPLSKYLWDHVPLLPMVQFPWRFLSLQALFGALLIGALVRCATGLGPRTAWAAALILAALLSAGSLIGFHPEYLPISESDVTTQRLRLYELFTGNIGSTIRYEYLPRWVEPRPHAGPRDISPDAPARAIPIEGTLLAAERRRKEPTSRIWQVQAGTDGARVAFPLLYWPGWRATVDDTEVPVTPAESSGYVTLRVPSGAHTVELRLGRTPLRLWAESLSLAALAVALFLALRAGTGAARVRHEEPSQPTPSPTHLIQTGHGMALMALGFFALLALIVAIQPRISATGVDDLTMDFERMPYLHHNPDGVARDGWQITSYTYRTGRSSPPLDRVRAGDTLEITLHWSLDASEGADQKRSAAPARGELHLVSPAAVRHPDLPPLAATSFTVAPDPGATGAVVATLAIPDTPSPGLHLIRLHGTPPVYLRPVWITDGPRPAKALPIGTFADGALRLHDVQVDQPSPDHLDIGLDWSAARPVAANYGLSLSLTDPAGNEWLLQGSKPGYDTQPGLGFLPTSLWPEDRLFEDQHRPNLAAGAPPGGAYRLTVDLYNVTTWQSVGAYTETVAMTQVPHRSDAPLLAPFRGEIDLSSLDVSRTVRQGETFRATAYWTTNAPPSHDYTVAWELRGERRTISQTLPLAPGSSPQDWPARAWIAGRASINIPPTTPPGPYTVTLTLLDAQDSAPLGSHVYANPIEIVGRKRVWELPPMQRTVDVTFGGMIELAGYDLERDPDQDQLRLTLHWRALGTPDRHYTFFVHLADPQSGVPASQVDGMPRGFTYPTGQWAPGEVVSDQVELSTAGVPDGRYVLALGWYDPDTKLRLPARDSDGTPMPDDRAILQDTVSIP